MVYLCLPILFKVGGKICQDKDYQWIKWKRQCFSSSIKYTSSFLNTELKSSHSKHNDYIRGKSYFFSQSNAEQVKKKYKKEKLREKIKWKLKRNKNIINLRKTSYKMS